MYICICIELGTALDRGGELGSSTIFKNLMSPEPRRKWYYRRGVGLIKWYSTPSPNLSPYIFLGLDPSPPPLALDAFLECFCYAGCEEGTRPAKC